jgi:hypothetical protein
MINIITDHSRFTMQNVQDFIHGGILLDNYDNYGLDNLADSKMYLLNSIEFTT